VRRESSPRPGLIRARINNSNVVGVTTRRRRAPGTATYGYEKAIDLSGARLQPPQPRPGRRVRRQRSVTLSAIQALGDPLSVNNLGDPRLINFSNRSEPTHKHYVVVASAWRTSTMDGVVAVADIFASSRVFGGDPRGHQRRRPERSDIFDFLTVGSAGSCIGG